MPKKPEETLAALNGPEQIRRFLAASTSKIVGNKMVIFDALLQWREDLMAAAEFAIEQHKYWRADTGSTPAFRQQMLNDQAKMIEQCENRLQQCRKAMQELQG